MKFSKEERCLDKQDTLEMLKQGVAHAEIARELGRSTQYIVNLKNELVAEGLITIDEIEKARKDAIARKNNAKKSASEKKSIEKEKIRNERKAKVLEYLNFGSTVVEISTKLDIPISTLRQYVAELVNEGKIKGEDIKSQKEKNKTESLKRNDAILADWQTNKYTQQELAKKYDVSPALICSILQGKYEELINKHSSSKPKRNLTPNSDAVLSREEKLVLDYLLKGQNYNFIAKEMGINQSEPVKITNALKAKGVISSEQIKSAREKN